MHVHLNAQSKEYISCYKLKMLSSVVDIQNLNPKENTVIQCFMRVKMAGKP